jgi:alpha-L-fucosidase 2
MEKLNSCFRRLIFFLATILSLLLGGAMSRGISAAADLTLWYAQSAKNPMNEALAIGNGRMGGLIFGEPERERIVLNEDSLWTGDENPSGRYETMGAYQVLGNLFVHLAPYNRVGNYRRELDLSDATARVAYTADGVTYRREFFCSHPANALIARFTADRPGSYTGSLEADDGHGGTIAASGHRLVIAGSLDNGLKYEWQVLVVPEGGSVSTNDGTIEFHRCNSLTVFVVARTDYAPDPAKHFRGADPHPRLAGELKAASRKPYDALKAEHVKDFQALFGRMTLDLGSSSEAQRSLPTDRRKLEAARTFDPGLEQLLFQYGRYLLISCSRPGGLPANLQGLWNDRNDPPWHSDYHANINVQMNYWPAEVANLPECHEPFFDLIRSQLPAWRRATAAATDLKTPSGGMATRGFAIRTSHNISGGMGWKWDQTANAWYAHHLWEQYAFGLDKNYLRTAAYPILKETCEFWEDHLKALPDGRLVVPHGWSPEHGPEEDGVAYNQEIVWDLFDHYVAASDALGVDRVYRKRIASLRDQLAAPGVGSWGQLLEWLTEKKGANAVPKHPELDTRNDHHRHTSHLFAVYPGHQITLRATPSLAAAARVSLDARGTETNSDVREWSFAWRTALYARLHDGENAHGMLRQMFSERNTCPNLFGLHPPMQLDGNFGITGAMAEMLVQSHGGELELLPALPADWRDGSVKGLRAQGGFEVDLAWRAGRLTEAVIHSRSGGECAVRMGNQSRTFPTKAGKSYVLDGDLKSGKQ